MASSERKSKRQPAKPQATKGRRRPTAKGPSASSSPRERQARELALQAVTDASGTDQNFLATQVQKESGIGRSTVVAAIRSLERDGALVSRLVERKKHYFLPDRAQQPTAIEPRAPAKPASETAPAGRPRLARSNGEPAFAEPKLPTWAYVTAAVGLVALNGLVVWLLVAT